LCTQRQAVSADSPFQLARAAGAEVHRFSFGKECRLRFAVLGRMKSSIFASISAESHMGSIESRIRSGGRGREHSFLALLKPDGALVAVAAPSEALKEQAGKLGRRVLSLQVRPDGAHSRVSRR